ncbi:MAG TPA: hypothetical protein VMM37_07290, partial [Bacteroidota bacterium]|nr:hypothetical protein [Bacteroidota bacterium]
MKNLFLSLTCAVAVCSAAEGQQAKTIERHIPTAPAQKIHLLDFSATNIDFRTWDKNEIYLNIKVAFESSNRDYEDEYIRSVDVVQEQTDKSLTLTYKQPKQRSNFSWSNIFRLRFNTYNSVEVTGEIYVPRVNALELEADYSKVSLDNVAGDLSVSGKSSTIRLKDCKSVQEIDNDYGPVTIEQCAGAVHIHCTSGRVTVESFRGPAVLDADYSTIKVADVKGGVTVSSKSGTVTLDRIGGDLDVKADYSTVTVNDVKGFVQIRDQSGNIRVKTVDGVSIDAPYTATEITGVTGRAGKPITVSGQSGRLDLEDATGNVSVENPYSPIALKSIRGNVDIRTTSSEVTVEDVAGNLDVAAEYSSFNIEGLDADRVRMTNKSNHIDLDLNRSP